MRFSLWALIPAVLAAPLAPIHHDKRQDTIPGRYIAQLNDAASDSILASTIASVTGILGVAPQHTYKIGSFRGFAFSASNLQLTSVRALTAIASVEQDSKVYTSETQQNPPYGLARISHREPGATTYVYDSSAGEGTYSYIIDTGIRITHQDFGGRATWGANFAEDGSDTDGNGHGTHVAGTTGGSTYGVAKKTNLIAVKVLGADGSGATSQVLAGIQWAVDDATAKGRIGKAVANLSLGGLFSLSTNQAVTAAVQQGLFLAVAAGNNGLPTITSSPASAEAVCTVGATDAQDNRASFSNFGALVDIFAPGVNVTSTWNRSDADTNTISGTSMATPHVAGLGAYLLALEGVRDPTALCERIRELSTEDVIANPGLLSPNKLAFNGYTSSSK